MIETPAYAYNNKFAAGDYFVYATHLDTEAKDWWAGHFVVGVIERFNYPVWEFVPLCFNQTWKDYSLDDRQYLQSFHIDSPFHQQAVHITKDEADGYKKLYSTLYK